ncbi:hypothetical protein [Streptomyces sp. NBC_00316]|uniref:hypothetical protein n=1 Tax=Streptomyces sp. NBC_00316 TaxID=2975710 RepID=UPI002E299967|nr:hypothetical protein [Streptomyces sp. NBC_00316]
MKRTRARGGAAGEHLAYGVEPVAVEAGGVPASRRSPAGTARLGPGVVTPVVGDGAWKFTVSFPENVPDAVLEFLPGEGLWMHSAAYDRHLTGSAYAGRFFLDAATDRLYFDTVNPTPQGTP